jgi:hypothetical protein
VLQHLYIRARVCTLPPVPSSAPAPASRCTCRSSFVRGLVVSLLVHAEPPVLRRTSSAFACLRVIACRGLALAPHAPQLRATQTACAGSPPCISTLVHIQRLGPLASAPAEPRPPPAPRPSHPRSTHRRAPSRPPAPAQLPHLPPRARVHALRASAPRSWAARTPALPPADRAARSRAPPCCRSSRAPLRSPRSRAIRTAHSPVRAPPGLGPRSPLGPPACAARLAQRRLLASACRGPRAPEPLLAERLGPLPAAAAERSRLELAEPDAACLRRPSPEPGRSLRPRRAPLVRGRRSPRAPLCLCPWRRERGTRVEIGMKPGICRRCG